MSIERLLNYASGRCDRRTFWVSQVLILILGTLGVSFALLAIGGSRQGGSISGGPMAAVLVGLPLSAAILARIVIDMRRLHDRGKSAPWLLIVWIPVLAQWLLHDHAGAVGETIVTIALYLAMAWYVIDLGLLPGEKSVNAYGPPLPPRPWRTKEWVAAGGSLEKFEVNAALDRIVADKRERDRQKAQAAEQQSDRYRSRTPPRD